MTRTDLPEGALDERNVLLTMLNYVRATVRAKCEDVSADNAKLVQLPGSPLMTLSGLVNHVRWVEHSWIENRFFGEPDRGPWTDEDPDREFRIAVDYPITQLLDEYDEQSRRFDERLADVDLDTPAQLPLRDGRIMNLRWILFHLIEEIARHNGHLDILREMADGSTGD
ncbi:DinB family protein [Fodinicola acaciae]|uniref:DinB family protein n=1 Tax=Fodinicola acaciae TaxID=2681555 RepID=UPI0013D22046|nr:DinB family protein [Fodinicola acaciae]